LESRGLKVNIKKAKAMKTMKMKKRAKGPVSKINPCYNMAKE